MPSPNTLLNGGKIKNNDVNTRRQREQERSWQERSNVNKTLESESRWKNDVILQNREIGNYFLQIGGMFARQNSRKSQDLEEQVSLNTGL